jgi:hypothetical protein
MNEIFELSIVHIGVYYLVANSEELLSVENIATKYGTEAGFAAHTLAEAGFLIEIDGFFGMQSKKKALPGPMARFDLARAAYPGIKGSLQKEYDKFKKRHKDYKECIDKLIPGIEREAAYKKMCNEQGKFCADWKNFQTWIHNRCWEDEYATAQTTNVSELYAVYLRRRSEKAPTCSILSEDIFDEWSGETGRFAGRSRYMTKDSARDFFWANHSKDSSKSLVDAYNKLK